MQIKTLYSVILLAGLAACGQETSPPPATEAQPPTVAEPPAATPAPVDTMADSAVSPADAALERGRIKYGGICSGCHGKNGEGQGIFPRVAGKPAQELAAKLKDYREGKTLGEQTALMAPNAQNLSDEDIDSLANYMASLGG